MQNEFVTYQQALALKELGYDEECFAFYNGIFLDFKVQGGETCAPYLSTENRGEYPNAPLKQQVFRWFIKNYNIHGEKCISEHRRMNVNKWMYSITYLDRNTYSHSEETYGTPEEAESKLIDKLIEIAKQQKQ